MHCFVIFIVQRSFIIVLSVFSSIKHSVGHAAIKNRACQMCEKIEKQWVWIIIEWSETERDRPATKEVMAVFFAIVIKTFYRSIFIAEKGTCLSLLFCCYCRFLFILKNLSPVNDLRYGENFQKECQPNTEYCRTLNSILCCCCRCWCIKFIVLNSTMLVVYQFHCLARWMNEWINKRKTHYTPLYSFLPFQFLSLFFCFSMPLSFVSTDSQNLLVRSYKLFAYNFDLGQNIINSLETTSWHAIVKFFPRCFWSEGSFEMIFIAREYVSEQIYIPDRNRALAKFRYHYS